MEGEEESSNDSPKNGIVGFIDLHPRDESIVDLTGQVHQLPCCIKHNGSTSVSHYFKPKAADLEVDGLSVESSNFRGRKLQGTTIPIPEGYCGFVLGKMKNSDKRNVSEISKGNSNCWEMKAKFESITYWNRDSLPSHDDAFLRCFHWFAVANTLHRPVTTDELASASTNPDQRRYTNSKRV